MQLITKCIIFVQVISRKTGKSGEVPASYLVPKVCMCVKIGSMICLQLLYIYQETPLDDGAKMSSIAGHLPSKEEGESLLRHPWYCGKKSRIEAERILHRMRDGVFLIRESDVRHGEYAIAIK